MGYPTKVQLIRRKKGADQYYINFPTAVAEAMELQKGETIEWIIEDIFSQVRKEVESLAPASRPLCVALDDTILRKTGKTIPGAAYRKDPLGPPFNINLVWAQRRIQISAAVTDENHEVRMIPISFLDASTPRKPTKTAPPEQVELYKERMKQRNLNTLARETLRQLQQDRTAENGGTAPALHLAVDGS